MGKFRVSVSVEAEQWFPGKEIVGVTEQPSEIVFSRTGQTYYVSISDEDFEMSRYWLGTEKVPGPLTEEQKKGSGLFEPGWLEIRTESGEVYKRPVYPFATFDIKSGPSEPIATCRDASLYQDYAAAMKWPDRLPFAIGIIDSSQGKKIAAPGDWIVTGVTGERFICKPDIFARTYEFLEE